MATLLDPRFCMGDIFITATTGTCTEERNCGRAPKVVMRDCEVKVLLPALCALAKSRDDEAKALTAVDVGLPRSAEPMRIKRVALCDESSGDNDSGTDKNIVDVEEEYRQSLANTELKVFRKNKAALVRGHVCDVLKWWCVNEHK